MKNMPANDQVDLEISSQWQHAKRLIPPYFTEADRPEIEEIVQVYQRLVGKRRIELRRSIAQRRLQKGESLRIECLYEVLDRLFIANDNKKDLSPVAIRKSLFELAAGDKSYDFSPGARAKVMLAVAKQLDMKPAEIERAMFSDLPDERVLEEPQAPVEIEAIRLQANLNMIRRLLYCSESISIFLKGKCRPIIRQAKWKGLLCAFSKPRDHPGLTIEIDGPLTILCQTTMYGRRMGELLPFLARVGNFSLESKVIVDRKRSILIVKAGDPIFPRQSATGFDSKLEEKFFHQFSRLTTDWNLIREPEPIQVGTRLVFPDFKIEYHTNPSLCWFLEIIGFWTPEYIAKKIASYQQLKIEKLILCFRARDLPKVDLALFRAKIIDFKTRIDPKKILTILDSER